MKHLSRTALVTAILFIITSVLFLSFRARQEGAAEEILSRVEKTYADCKTYSDSGTSKFVLFTPTGNITSQGRFTTAFVGPDRLRFDFQEIIDGKQARTILWRSGNDISTWSTITGQIKQKQNLLSALSETGVYTYLSAYTIPSLLFQQELKGRILTTMSDIERADDADLDGIGCFRLMGKKAKRKDGSGGVNVTLWIDKTSSLIRRIDWLRSGSEITLMYEPIIDGEIKDGALVFDVPLQ